MNRVDSKERLTELSLLMYDFLPTAYKAGVPKLHAVVSGIIAAAGPHGVHAAAGYTGCVQQQ